MKAFVLIAFVIGAIIVVCLYVIRLNTVPADVRNTLQTEQGGGINRMTQVPAAVRAKIDKAYKKADSNMSDAMKNMDK